MHPLAPGLVLVLAPALLGPGVQEGGIVGGGGRGEAGQRGAKPAPREEDEDLAQKYFEVADHNADGWITFREAEESLGLDRNGWKVYDGDEDGRISPKEFRTRYETVLQRGGAFAPPLGKSTAKQAGALTAGELGARFDKDGNGDLNQSELRSLLESVGSRLDPEVALVKFDRDGSHQLEKAEIADLAAFLDPTLRTTPVRKVGTVGELFGTPIPREERAGMTKAPPRILGPVPAFLRLDLDRDGSLEIEDLVELQRPIQLPVRLSAVFATLDKDRDGRIGTAEFAAAMGAK